CAKKIETVTLAGLNNYVLNSPPQVRSLSSFYSYMFDSLKSSRQPVDPTEQAPQADADVSPSDETSAPKKLSRLCTKYMVFFLYAKSSLLRAECQYLDYNIREYTKRKTLDGFRINKNLSDPSNVEEASAEGKAQLEVVERMLKVNLVYPPKTKNIMELKLQ
ncbi:BnaC05g49750D, partial [Brassica napus]